MSIDDSLPTDLASAHALIIAHRQALIAAQSEAQHRALLIEIELASGGRMRITGPVDARTVAALMKALAKSKRRR